MIDCPKDRSINIILLEAPIDQVWWSIVTPSGSNSYLTDQVITTGIYDEPKLKDRYTLYYGDIINHAEIMDIVHGERFILSDRYESMAPDGSVHPYHVRTEYTMEQYGAFTRLKIEVIGHEQDTYGQWFRECLEMGWRRSLMNLKSVLELGMDLRTELFSYPRLGVTNCTVNEVQHAETGVASGQGNYLLDVFPNSPADQAGLQPGDVILAMDDIAVPYYASFVRVISRYYGKKQPVKITFVRSGETHHVQADFSLDRMFTGLIEGTDEGQRLEQERRKLLSQQRSASGALWKREE